MIRRKTGGADGVYFTYTEDKPISFNPFYTDDYIFDVEKKDSIKTLLLTLWKSEDDKVTKTESGELGSAVSAYIERIQSDRSIVPSFNTFYEYMRDDYRKELAQRDIKVEKSDFNIDNMLTTMRQYYRGGRYDFLLNSTENIDLLGKRFIVFEIDSIKENRELFPVVTIIIMEAFINKMRRLKGVRKQLIVEEAWKALSSANMAEYLRYMYKTVRKYYGEAIVVTQEVDDIISSPVVKESIINNSDCKILLDQRKYMNKFDQIQALLGLTEKDSHFHRRYLRPTPRPACHNQDTASKQPHPYGFRRHDTLLPRKAHWRSGSSLLPVCRNCKSACPSVDGIPVSGQNARTDTFRQTQKVRRYRAGSVPVPSRE